MRFFFLIGVQKWKSCNSVREMMLSRPSESSRVPLPEKVLGSLVQFTPPIFQSRKLRFGGYMRFRDCRVHRLTDLAPSKAWSLTHGFGFKFHLSLRGPFLNLYLYQH